MKTIKVKINCGNKYCNDCFVTRRYVRGAYSQLCPIHDRQVMGIGKRFIRCQACLDAEEK